MRLAHVIVVALLPMLGLLACKAPPPDPDAPPVPAQTPIAEHDCFWNGPWVREDPERNYAFPDTAAAYWAARFKLPENGRLIVEGEFAQARYLSLVAYDADGRPTDALTDYAIEPLPGQHNPFRPGESRSAKARAYRVEVVGGDVPAQRAPNTLYLGRDAQKQAALIYRIYVPDQGLGRTAGVPLPRVRLVVGDAAPQDLPASCAAIEANREPMPSSVPAKAVYELGRGRPLQPRTFPADDPLSWHAFYDAKHLASCLYFKRCEGEPERTGGVYSNPDNAYVAGMISRGFGPVLVLRGRMPKVPATHAGGGRMQDGELRFWSLCNNEAATQKVMACLYDEQVPLDAERRYTIVVSREQDRPANARAECGMAWLAWSEVGDGAGHADDGMLFLRNMLPAADFAQAVQRTRKPGDEASVMGDRLPTGQYMTREAVEGLGCG